MSKSKPRVALAVLAAVAILAATAGAALAARTVISVRTFAWGDDPSTPQANNYNWPDMAPDGRIAYSFFEGAAGGTARARVYDPARGTSVSAPATTNGQVRPRVWGDWLVYETLPPKESSENSSVRAVNLKTGASRTLSTTPNEYGFGPEIWGNRVVWSQHGPSTAPVVYTASLSPPSPATVLLPATAFKGVPAGSVSNICLYENMLAFDRYDMTGMRYDVWLYDLSRLNDPYNTPQKLSEGEVGRTLLCDLEGQRVAWYRESTPETDDAVVIWDIPSGEKTVIENATDIELIGDKAIVCNTADSPVTWDLYDPYLRKRVPIETEVDDGQLGGDGDGLSGFGWRFTGVAAPQYDQNNLIFGTVLAPSVAARTASGVVAQGARPKITGSVSEAGTPIVGGTIRLEMSYNGKDFVSYPPYTQATIGSGGAFSITVPEQVRGTIYYRAVFLGRTSDSYVQHLSATSSPVKLTAPVKLGRPVVPKTKKRNSKFTVYGSIAPGLDEGSRWVRVQAYRYERGKWRYKKYFVATPGVRSGQQVYTTSAKLTSKGRWRMRAYWPTSASHPQSYSSWSKTITVK